MILRIFCYYNRSLRLNVFTLDQTKIDNINRMVTITDDFLLSNLVNGMLKADLIKWMITLTSDYIKRLSLYYEKSVQ